MNRLCYDKMSEFAQNVHLLLYPIKLILLFYLFKLLFFPFFIARQPQWA